MVHVEPVGKVAVVAVVSGSRTEAAWLQPGGGGAAGSVVVALDGNEQEAGGDDDYYGYRDITAAAAGLGTNDGNLG